MFILTHYIGFFKQDLKNGKKTNKASVTDLRTQSIFWFFCILSLYIEGKLKKY